MNFFVYEVETFVTLDWNYHTINKWVHFLACR